ncbi:uncharacterized protein Tco025E_02453 [Trypanosoma conorhini]|uniref:Uncharacterized protein n=1 Tax=Trypanosoma conorhini TaxID=83891 RepID=A0A3R7NN99_9TRYP|nr:uncharacterized protein Tco025E_02453 [Trypanosoma conorhini]RNF24483.1 hypothetical protein Tco025E_02453 [Trypanosoma conorhini]
MGGGARQRGGSFRGRRHFCAVKEKKEMLECIIDTNADIDVLLRELRRLKEAPRATAAAPAAVLSWADICADPALEELFQERLSSVMSAAKKQRTIYFPRERLLIGSNGEVEVELLAPHLRLLPESTMHSKSRQEERRAAFKEARLRALEAHKEKMMQLVMQRIELPGRAGGGSRAPTAAAAAAAEEATGADADAPPSPPLDGDGAESDGSLPPPPPPAAETDGDDVAGAASEGAGAECDDDDDPPPPPPPLEEDEDDDDDPPPPPPPE